MHPDALDAQINTLLDDLVGDIGIGEDEHRLRLVGNGFQVRVARIALKGRQVRIDGEDGVARFLELVVAQVATGLPLSDADYCNLFWARKPGFRHDLSHVFSSGYRVFEREVSTGYFNAYQCTALPPRYIWKDHAGRSVTRNSSPPRVSADFVFCFVTTGFSLADRNGASGNSRR
jgi:hypothetical protein